MKCHIYEMRPGQPGRIIKHFDTKKIGDEFLKNMFTIDRISRNVEWVHRDKYVDICSQYVYGIEKD